MKDYLRPSSLGSYFGVGFNTPQQQFLYDTGQEEVVFDEESKARMNLGNFFEDKIIDYFEELLGIIITDRNTKVIHLYDGKLHGKVDGRTIYNGAPAVVEAKMSNSKYKNFTESVGYEIQSQCYMMDDPSIENTVLIGLQNGKPQYRIIKRDEEMIEDIKTMVDYVLGLMRGDNSWDDYPQHLVEKYSGTKLLPEIDTLEDYEIDYLEKLASLNEQIRDLQQEKSYIESHLKNNYDPGRFENDKVKMVMGVYSRKGGFDIERLKIDHPDVDLESYRNPDTSYKTLRITKK